MFLACDPRYRNQFFQYTFSPKIIRFGSFLFRLIVFVNILKLITALEENVMGKLFVDFFGGKGFLIFNLYMK